GGGYSHPRQFRVTPTAAQWQEFRQTLDDLQVWRWRAKYPNTDTDDGTQWSLDVAFPGRAITTHGDNNYPGRAGKPNGQPESTAEFRRYLSAVEKLIGKTFE